MTAHDTNNRNTIYECVDKDPEMSKNVTHNLPFVYNN